MSFGTAPERPGRHGRRTRRVRALDAARHGTGWLLVDMGLRLAMPRAGAKHSIASGRR